MKKSIYFLFVLLFFVFDILSQDGSNKRDRILFNTPKSFRVVSDSEMSAIYSNDTCSFEYDVGQKVSSEIEVGFLSSEIISRLKSESVNFQIINHDFNYVVDNKTHFKIIYTKLEDSEKVWCVILLNKTHDRIVKFLFQCKNNYFEESIGHFKFILNSIGYLD